MCDADRCANIAATAFSPLINCVWGASQAFDSMSMLFSMNVWPGNTSTMRKYIVCVPKRSESFFLLRFPFSFSLSLFLSLSHSLEWFNSFCFCFFFLCSLLLSLDAGKRTQSTDRLLFCAVVIISSAISHKSNRMEKTYSDTHITSERYKILFDERETNSEQVWCMACG